MKKWIDKLLRMFGYMPILRVPEFYFEKVTYKLVLIKSQRIVSTLRLNDPSYEEYMKHKVAQGMLHELIPLMDYSCKYHRSEFSPDRTEKLMCYEIYVAVKQK